MITSSLVGLLIALLILVFIWWAAGLFGVPNPFRQILGVILFIIFLVYALRVFGFAL